jgi:hypothetical protein
MLAARTTFFLHAITIAMLVMVGGCESLPVQEMSDARQAIMAAREAGAEEHAGQQLIAAETALRNAEQSLGAKSYSVAQREATQAKSLAIEALRISEAASGEEN